MVYTVNQHERLLAEDGNPSGWNILPMQLDGKKMLHVKRCLIFKGFFKFSYK